MQHPRSLAATCEDYNSDASETVPDTRKQANVAAKRTTPSPALEKVTGPVGPDGASDSGYSSHTAATIGSADSAPSLKAGHASLKLDIPATGGAPGSPTKRKPQLSDVRRQKKNPSPSRTSSSRSQSQSRKSKPAPMDRYASECADPRCECSRGRRGPPSALDTPLSVNYPPFVKQPSPQYYKPPSPQAQRLPPGYSQPGPIVEPARSSRPTSSTRARPTSYHAGINPEAYWSPMQFGPVIDQQGRPPLPPAALPMSVYPTGQLPYTSSMMTSPQSNPSYLPPPTHLPEASPPSPYRNPRPSIPHRATETYSARGPGSVYGQPLVSYDQPGYGISSTISARQPSARRPTNPSEPHYDDLYDSFSSSEDEDERHYDRVLMPPPPVPRTGPIPSRRPSMRQPAPSHNYPTRSPHRLQSSSRNALDRDFEERGSARVSSHTSNSSSRPSSSRRPSLASASGRSKTTSYTGSGGRVTVVESSASNRRRLSYMGHERRAELEAKRRDVEAYQNEVAARAKPQQQSRRDPEVVREREARRRSTIIEGQTFVDPTRPSPPLTEQTLRAAKRASRISAAASSETGSGRSRASSTRDDGGSSRVSATQRPSTESRTLSGSSTSTANPAAVPSNGEGFKMRIDGINLEFLGDMEGRTISLRPQEEGVAEVVIGSTKKRDADKDKNDRETVYEVTDEGRSVTSRSRAESVRGSGRRRRSRAASDMRGRRRGATDD